MTAPLQPHRSRVVVPGHGAGMVVAVHNARRRLLGAGGRAGRVDDPARVVVKLDDGRRIEWAAADVELEAST